MFTPSQNPLLMMNRMNFGGQTGNQDIQPLAPDAAYQAGNEVDAFTANIRGNEMMPLAGRYAAFINNV
tara:strand:- start:18 stop:221 length:204 start_codon:yes stop_codon:yes gene_type:complete